MVFDYGAGKAPIRIDKPFQPVVLLWGSPYDNEQIKADFNELYQLMSGMPLREMDKIIYLVCTLCRDHEKSGFIEGVKAGIRLYTELD